MAPITDCLTITVHAGKCYKALIDSGAAISLIRYPTYQLIDDSFKTPIQPTTTTLNTADGLSMTALGMTALYLKIAEFKFIHNFIICDRLSDTEIIFGIDVQKKFSQATQSGFISNQESTKGKDPNINIVNGIHNIKEDHLSIFWYQIIAANMSCLTKGNI